jgi:hypothetical protein
MLDLQKHIYNFCKNGDYEIRGEYIKFAYDKNLEEFLHKRNIVFEAIRKEEIHIKYKEIGFTIFPNVKEYLTINNVSKNLDILIIVFDNKALSNISNQCYIDFEQKNDFFFFSNAHNFVEFIDFLSSKEQETDDAFHFIDYANDINRKIVLTSIAEKSRIILKYYKEIAETTNSKDFSKGFTLFKNCFVADNYNLPKFLKSSLIKFSLRYDSDERINFVFQNLRSIVEDAKMNFEIYINNLSIDKIRKDYDDYKSKYFSEVSDVLRKLSQQIIGFPIVTASTLFGIEKIKSNDTLLCVLAIVILVTTLYLILLLRMNFRDLKYVEQLSDKDYQALKDNNFFIKFPDEFKLFTQIKMRISTRIKNLIIVCESYFWILSLSNTVLIGLMLSYLKVPIGGIILISLGLIIIMILARNIIWDEKIVE